jgi:hypothetical protein
MKSVKAADFCFECERTIAPGETVYRVKVSTRNFFSGEFSKALAIHCEDCGRTFTTGQRERFRVGERVFYEAPKKFSKEPCGYCQRNVFTESTARDANVILCSWRCSRHYYTALDRERRFEQRKDTVCQTCGDEFTPKRADAKHCSPACKQKAYRDKHK